MRIHVVTLLVAAAIAHAAASTPVVQCTDGRVTAALSDADPAEVLREIGRQSGIEIRGSLVEPRPLTLELDAVPLEQVFTRLLTRQSFSLTYRGDRLSGVRLLGGAEPDVALWTPPYEDSPPGMDDADSAAALESSHAPIAIGGRLARAVGSEQTSFAQIMGVAMQHPDPRVRADALRVGLRALEGAPQLRASFLDLLDHMTDEGIAAWVERMAGPYADDVIRQAVRTTHIEPLRRRAIAVERTMALAAPSDCAVR